MELPAYFETLMNRAPIPAADIFMYLREMRRTPSGPLVTSKLLAAKIQSQSEAQALHAFEFLEAALEAEAEGSIEFRTEVGRCRFLNEIIRILSPKYLGNVTPDSVKERATKFLCDAAGPKKQRWFPSEHSKIKTVYQSLVESGIINSTAEEQAAAVDAAEAELQKSIFDRTENAAILKKLLTSTDPADLNAANRLIKSLVEEESKRNERRAELHSLIDRIETSTTLFTEMLNQPTLDNELAEDLAETCKNLRQKLSAIPTETNNEVTSILQASDNIENVLTFFEDRKNGTQPTVAESASDLLNTPAGLQEPIQQSSGLSLADELLMGLSEEFAPQIDNGKKKSEIDTENLLNLDVEDTENEIWMKAAETDDKKVGKGDTLGEIERISRELIEEGLKNSQGMSAAFPMKKTEKSATLSQLQKTVNQPGNVNTTAAFVSEDLKPKPQPTNSNLSYLDLDFLQKPSSQITNCGEKKSDSCNKNDCNAKNLTGKSPRGSTSNDDDSLLNLNENHKPDNRELNNEVISEKNFATTHSNFSLNTVKEVDLDEIELLKQVEPLELELKTDSGTKFKDVNVTITFGRMPDYPSVVLVAVISLTNRNSSSELLNYVFQMLPPKGMQVKLLAPSCMELAPWKKSFLPPPVLTQVALLMTPSHVSNRRIKYILSYCLNEDTALHDGHFELPTTTDS